MSLLLRNARLSAHEPPVDVLVEDGRITGMNGRLAATRSRDLDGRFLIPGLWDNHVHFSQWAESTRRLDVSSARSAADAAELVRVHVASPATGEHGPVTDAQPVVGSGFRDGLWPDAPSVALLDAAAGQVPVILMSADLHCCWLNSAALAVHGYAGHPTGVLREEDCFAVTRSLDNVADDVSDAWAREAAAAAAARGVVGVIDLEMDWNIDTWIRRISRGSTNLRIEFGIYPQHLERATEAGLQTGHIVDGAQGLLTVGPFKVITDGSLNTRTAYCFHEYPGMEGMRDSRGVLTVPPEELLPLMRRAAENHLTPHLHAIGDHANRLALDAFEAIGCRGAIEHAQLLADSDVERFARLGVVASVQPEHAMDDRDVTDRYWAGRTRRAFALASLVSAGAELAFGSDAPVAPLDPWVTMAAAVGRARDGRDPWHPEQAVTREVALAASARGRTTIAVGEVADLAVVDIDPLTATVDEIRNMPVAATLLGGRFTHDELS